jgi:glycosyltransferase involved in cell wall biosynthesis
MAPEPRRITLVTDELLGYTRTGGLGTATSYLAVALGRMGHRVELLYVSDPPSRPLGAEWAELYEEAGVAIRILGRSETRVEPPYFARMRDVEQALAADPPDVVITQDLAAPAYTAIRMRQLGLAFNQTLFVVYCHGTRRWITDVARKVRVLPGALGVTLLEQASLELADVVVSPSEYLVDWMQMQRWRLPTATHVIPHLTRAAATGEQQPRAQPTDGPVRRIVFFGRLEERKGIRPFIEALNTLPSGFVRDLEVEFIGRPTPAWTPDRVKASLSDGVRTSFETDLDQPEALLRLTRPGTLAVMPSYAETFGYTVRECLDSGIPFIAGDVAAIRELVAPEDRGRVLFEPTAAGIENALRQLLSDTEPIQPARAAFHPGDSRRAWAEILATGPEPSARPTPAAPAIDVVVQCHSCEASARCREALERQTYTNFRVVVAEGSTGEARQSALKTTSAPFVLFLHEDDEPEPELLVTLVRAREASDSDAVSCGLRLHDSLHFFHGDPGGLGVLSNSYGTVALLRRSLLAELTTRRPVEGDLDWPLLADLHLRGARIVSVPAPLVSSSRHPGSVDGRSSDPLLVVERLEGELPSNLKLLARVTAGLSATGGRQTSIGRSVRRRSLRLHARPSS